MCYSSGASRARTGDPCLAKLTEAFAGMPPTLPEPRLIIGLVVPWANAGEGAGNAGDGFFRHHERHHEHQAPAHSVRDIRRDLDYAPDLAWEAANPCLRWLLEVPLKHVDHRMRTRHVIVPATQDEQNSAG